MQVSKEEHASLAMPNSYPRDRIYNPHLTPIKGSYNKENV